MYPRFAKSRIGEALADTCVVLISRPRQSGETTLATDIACDQISFLSLDVATVLRSALDDSVGFIRGLDLQADNKRREYSITVLRATDVGDFKKLLKFAETKL